MHLFIKKNILTIGLSVTLLVSGCSSNLSSNNQTSVTMNNVVIAEPLVVNFKSEVAIARLTEVINRAKLTEEQRAQLFYDRGVLYDSVGLLSLARFDFSHALKLKPDLVDAYNFLGIHYTQLQEFSQAYEYFDSALDLAPDHEYAYLNRGIALYYGSRAELARADFKTFHERLQDDPYRLLWLYLTEHEIDPIAAKKRLQERAKLIDEKTWAKQIVYLFSGNISENSFIKSLTQQARSNRELTEHLCEAYFYLGKYNQILGKQIEASNYFKLALSTNVYEFVEHRYARLELNLMRTKKVIVAKPELH